MRFWAYNVISGIEEPAAFDMHPDPLSRIGVPHCQWQSGAHGLADGGSLSESSKVRSRTGPGSVVVDRAAGRGVASLRFFVA